MAEFIYTTSTSVGRPVFIEADKLESLDKILDEECERLSRYNATQLEEHVEKELLSDIESLQLSIRLRKEGSIEDEMQKRREELMERFHRSHFRESRNITIYLKGGLCG